MAIGTHDLVPVLDQTKITDGDFTSLTLASLTAEQTIRRSGTSLASSTCGVSNWPISHHAGTTDIEIWFTGAVGNAAYGSSGNVLNVLRAYPFILPAARTADRIAIECTTAAALTNARCGIYQATSATNYYPNTLLVDGGDQLMTTTGMKITNINQALLPGVVYWLASVANSAAMATRNLTILPSVSIGSPAPPPIGNGHYLTVAYVYAALPATFTAGATIGSTTSVCPVVGLRFSA